MGNFSENLKRIMAERGYSQSELARKSGVSQTSISNYLRRSASGEMPLLHNASKLAKALGVSMEELTGDPAFRNFDKPTEDISPAVRELAERLAKLPPHTLRLIEGILLGLDISGHKEGTNGN